MALHCPQCSEVIQNPAIAFCASCGYQAAPPATAYTKDGYWIPPKAPPSLSVAITALLLNILFVAGSGSLIASRFLAGISQLALYAGGTVLTLYFIFGMPNQALVAASVLALTAGWIWSLVTGIQLIIEASQAPQRGTPPMEQEMI